MPQDDLQQRIQQSLYQSRKKPWYRRGWGIGSLALGVVLIIFVLAFGSLVAFYYGQFSSGELFSRAANQIEHQARIDLLQEQNDPSVGPMTAPVTIVAFEDFECPFCFQAQPFLKRLLTRYSGDIRFIYKDFPLQTIHPNALSAAEAAQCAFEQGKFWEFHDELFANQERFAEAYYRVAAREVGLNISQFNACVAEGRYRQQVNEDIEVGRSLGVVGTPTFFVNGELFAQGYSDDLEVSFEQAVEFILSL